ncbi:hypothetical protein N5O88_09820 [Pseudomonas sp. GD03721]|nr:MULTISPECIES: hypothetical protein [unclassified Pseudomonas]MDH1440439.1 hypothetical protein [Pseudomonas sp. GD03722]WGG03473.1 hypothetical protein N5O88_09820 [Pseudomonas sp. GD03721]WGG07641.1 hypothetical protein N5O87_09830 [Pseudomonas sp. GD03919]
MELRPEFLIQTVIKAMTDTVLPAVDPNNKLATEQAQLVIGMLGIVRQRLPLMYRFDRDELDHMLALASALHTQAVDVPGVAEHLQALTGGVAAGRDVLSRAKAEPDELVAANFALREQVGALITALYADAGSSDLKRTSALVTGHAREQLLRDRAFLIAQGWETDPQAIPDLETLLSQRTAGN